MEDESEEEQIIDPEVLTEIDTNKINRGSGVARGGTRGRGTPRRVRFLISFYFQLKSKKALLF